MKQKNSTKTCTVCVMTDESDPTIEFDEAGQCNYCRKAIADRDSVYFPNALGQKKLNELIDTLKDEGKGKDFDCLMGLSGGLDSSYLAYLGAAKWGLRTAAVHVDDGYDTEISKSNIQKLVDATGLELIVISPDPEQFNDLTLAYMKAGVPNLAVPQDNILVACLYEYAKENGIKNFLSGGNYALECILQRGNTYTSLDLVNIKDINRRFGTKGIDKLPFISRERRFLDGLFRSVQSYRPLNYIDYNRDRAFAELNDYCGFEYYGRKHLENHLTAFLQLYWLPKKFGVDKRTSHLSSMIASEQMTREQAFVELQEPLYDEQYMAKVKNMLCANFDISLEELEALVDAPSHQHEEYKTDRLMRAFDRIR